MLMTPNISDPFNQSKIDLCVLTAEAVTLLSTQAVGSSRVHFQSGNTLFQLS